MPARKQPQGDLISKIARLRVKQGLTQAELAAQIGISATTITRLERTLIDNPPLGWLVNAALALGVELEDVIDGWMLNWHTTTAAPEPPPGRRNSLRR